MLLKLMRMKFCIRHYTVKEILPVTQSIVSPMQSHSLATTGHLGRVLCTMNQSPAYRSRSEAKQETTTKKSSNVKITQQRTDTNTYK